MSCPVDVPGRYFLLGRAHFLCKDLEKFREMHTFLSIFGPLFSLSEDFRGKKARLHAGLADSHFSSLRDEKCSLPCIFSSLAALAPRKCELLGGLSLRGLSQASRRRARATSGRTSTPRRRGAWTTRSGAGRSWRPALGVLL